MSSGIVPDVHSDVHRKRLKRRTSHPRPKHLIIDKTPVPAAVRAAPKKKDRELALLSLIFLCFIWVPLFNVFFFIPLSFYFGLRALYLAHKYPTKYGGRFLAAGVVLVSFFALWLSVYGFVTRYLL